ncbi:hypothetical protein Aperf_G00000121655 [Anoplocephala perfoliata]
MISVLAPSILKVEAVSPTSVKVFITRPKDTTGIKWYSIASIEGDKSDESQSCVIKVEEEKEELSCEISNLSPGTQYTVKACSWLGDEASTHNCDPEEKSVWTKPLAPSILKVEAVSPTSVKVFITRPKDTTGIKWYSIASIEGDKSDESQSCVIKVEEEKEELSCEISNLSPGTQYTVKACSWLGDEASTHNCDPEEKSVWTKPLAPSILKVEAVSPTSVKVFITRPKDTTGIKWYSIASIEGDKSDESQSCVIKLEEEKEELSCEISNLSPGTQYTVKACSWLGDEASTHNCDPEEKSVWTKPLAPSILKVEAVSPTSVKVFITRPKDTTGIKWYSIASIEGDKSDEPQSCVIKVEEEKEELSCEISNLSPGTQYTVKACSWLGDEASTHNCDPEEKSVWTKPLAPSILKVEAVSPTSVKVFITRPKDTTGIKWYSIASIEGDKSDESQSCVIKLEEEKEELSCEISNLSPGTQYTVKACSWLGDEASTHNCDPEEKSVWTKPLAPSILKVEAVSPTSVKVFITRPKDTTGIKWYSIASIEGDKSDESQSCVIKVEEEKEELSCEISNLSPGTQYTVKACSWLGDEASSLRSDPDEKSVWTKPLAPSILKVEAVSPTSVKVFITRPKDTTGIKWYSIASIEGDKSDESQSCVIKVEEEKEELSCEISNLSPGTQYTVKARSWLGDEASTHNCDPEEKSVWTKPLAPSILKVEAVSPTSVKVFITRPKDTTGIKWYSIASIEGDKSDESQSCVIKLEEEKEELSCEISNLSPGTQYTVKACSWLGYEASSLRSDPDEKSVWTKPLAPSILKVEAVSPTSVKVFITRPKDTTGIKWYSIASIEGDKSDESQSCVIKVEEEKEELSCEISNLSPGTQYTVKACSWLGDEASTHNCDPEEKSVWTKPLAPSIVNVEAVSSTSGKVIIKKPVDITGIEKYTANIKGDESKSCVIKEEEKLSCEISDLSPGTQYTVNAYSWLGYEASSLRSDPDEKSGWTKPSAPSIVNVEAVSSTSGKVIIKKPVDITGIEKYTANIKGDESKSCVIKEEEKLSCEISDLSPGTQYTVNAYSWLGYEASSLRSDPDEKSGWTKPSAPSILKVEAVSPTSVKVFITRPKDTTGIKWYSIASIEGDKSDESQSCVIKVEEEKEELSCEISNLSPGTQYTVKACSWLGDEASTHNCDPEEKSVWTKPLAPSIVNVEAVSSTSGKVIIKKPVDITGIEKYTANIKGDESKSCVIKEEEKLSCEISDLSPGTQYTVNAYSWLGYEASSLRSDPDEKSGWTKPSAPCIVNVEAVSSTSVKVFITRPKDTTGIKWYSIASIEGDKSDESQSCVIKVEEEKEELSCEISNLSPGTQYTVKACSWLGDEASTHNCDPEEKSVWTKPLETQTLLMRKAVGMSALTVEQFEPPELSYLLQIPQSIPFAEFSGRLQALNDPAVSAGLFQSFDDKQTIETFENECRLTRRTAEQFRDRHRYGNVLPSTLQKVSSATSYFVKGKHYFVTFTLLKLDEPLTTINSVNLFISMQCVTTECRAEPQKFGAPEGTDERFADPCELLMSRLLK